MEILEANPQIRKYMDLARFVSLLTTSSLYFACPAQFDDPYEGLLPKSHHRAESAMIDNLTRPVRALRDQMLAAGIPAGAEYAAAKLNAGLDKISRSPHHEVNAKFGVNCWHESDYDSDAMWKLYAPAGFGVAIESTPRQLMESLVGTAGLQIDRVRYMDFENDPIEKGHRRYRLFIKRKSFQHEREVRATLVLQTPGAGVLVPCNLDTLVTRIHVAPRAEPFVKLAIEALCTVNLQPLNKPVEQSALYRVPYAV